MAKFHQVAQKAEGKYIARITQKTFYMSKLLVKEFFFFLCVFYKKIEALMEWKSTMPVLGTVKEMGRKQLGLL
jgi:hypothetical protein